MIKEVRAQTLSQRDSDDAREKSEFDRRVVIRASPLSQCLFYFDIALHGHAHGVAGQDQGLEENTANGGLLRRKPFGVPPLCLDDSGVDHYGCPEAFGRREAVRFRPEVIEPVT